VRAAVRVADARQLRTVVLSGGSFQNARLLAGVRRRLAERGLRVLVPRKLGPNDGAISYGQAAVAATLLARHS
jgi:hydrogenase maturation protein HypF